MKCKAAGSYCGEVGDISVDWTSSDTCTSDLTYKLDSGWK
jgi:hypothetical protein